MLFQDTWDARSPKQPPTFSQRMTCPLARPALTRILCTARVACSPFPARNCGRGSTTRPNLEPSAGHRCWQVAAFMLPMVCCIACCFSRQKSIATVASLRKLASRAGTQRRP